MNTPPSLQNALAEIVERRQHRLLDLTRELIRIPSENTPPKGAELACQNWLAEQLRNCGLLPELYFLHEVPGLHEHPLFQPGRDYTDRPNLAARVTGTGGGRSLLLSGHIDTVPVGAQSWMRDPFGGQIEGNRLVGRGANDMKSGIATNLFVIECLKELDLPLAGDLLFEAVVDEEFGGANGTLAARLRGPNADAAILSEPSSLRICPAQRGGRTAHISFTGASGGVLQNNSLPAGAIPQLTCFLSRVKEFAARRSARAVPHEMYAAHADPVPVTVTKVFTSPWGFSEPITIPETASVELYWQLMPGETQPDVEREFEEWMSLLVSEAPDVFSSPPSWSFPIRWMPGSSIPASEPIVQALSACAKQVLGQSPLIEGIEGPCDLFLFQQEFRMPSVIWGARGGNTHAADEYVEIDSLIAAAKTLLLFAVEWCGTVTAP